MNDVDKHQYDLSRASDDEIGDALEHIKPHAA